MPRLPVIIEQGDRCRGEESRNYAAYNDGVVYVVKITSKVKAYEFCSPRKDFDENSFHDRVNALKAELKDASKSDTVPAPDSVVKLVGTTGAKKVIKLVNDYKNERWFELSVYGGDETRDEVDKFFASFTTDKTTTGIDIQEGADRVFGDDAASIVEEFKFERNGKTETGNRKLVKIEDRTESGVMIVLKSRANYSDAARRSQTQGRVALRVTFQANGAIGDVAVISGLPNGLTEEAVKAARKILFIPAQRDGARYSVTKAVEYSFRIY